MELFAVDNEVPIVIDDAAGSVQSGLALAISVLTNDSDPDGQLNAETVNIVTQPGGGTVAVAATGIVTYTASATFSGSDQFTYTVADQQGARSPAATVRITVTAPPPPPPPPPPPVGSGSSSSSSGGGGGGGAFGAELLCLMLLAASRRLVRRLVAL